MKKKILYVVSFVFMLISCTTKNEPSSNTSQVGSNLGGVSPVCLVYYYVQKKDNDRKYSEYLRTAED